MARWSRLRSWFTTIFLRSRVERDIDDELRFHVDEMIEQGIAAGLSPEQARSEAHASLGTSVSRVNEACREQRGLSFVDGFTRDITHGARVLRRNPVFAATVLATLAISIGSVVTVFSIVDAWLLRPLNFPKADRLVIGFAAAKERPTEPAVWMPYRAFLHWRERSRSFESVSAAFIRGFTLVSDADARSAVGMNVSAEFFETLGVRPHLGRTLSAADVNGPRVVVLSYGLWERHFGAAAAAVGSTVSLSGTPHEIVGVMPRDFDVRMLDRPSGLELWTLFDPADRQYSPDGMGPIAIIGRLRDGLTIERAQAEVAAITRETEARHRFNFLDFVVLLSSLQADNTRTIRATLITVSVAVAGLLLISAMNVGTLLLGRGLGRMHEAAIRAAIGSSRSRLLRQFLTEGLLISLLGGLWGLACAVAATRLFVAWNPLATLPANPIEINWRALVVAAVAMAVTTVICGLVPAWRVSAADPHDALHAGGERGPAATPTRRAQTAMLVGQMAASVVLLVATVLLGRTVVRLQTEPLGFEPTGLTVADVLLPADPFDSSEARNAFYRELARHMAALPGVTSVAAGTSPPLSSGAPVTVNSGPEDDTRAPRISAQDVTPEFFDTLGVLVVAGRAFDARDTAGAAQVLVLNARAAAQLFGDARKAVGQRLRLDQEPWREVIGVVGDTRSTFFNRMEWQSNPVVYRPSTQAFSTLNSPSATSFGLHLHIRADRPLTMAEVRKTVESVNSSAAVTEFRLVPDLVADATRQPAFRVMLLSWFAVTSLLLAAIGVYGLVAQAIQQRLRDIAIRLALGAEPGRVVAAVTRGALLAGVSGCAIGIGAAWAMAGTLERLLYGVRATDAVSFAFAVLSLLVVTALAAFIPAFRATRVDPVTVLRGD
jgi:predicted permease